MKEKYYITTAIPYTSGKPHIGNTYEMILTDCIARYKRLCGYDVLFLTGADEHGQKIELAAAEKQISEAEQRAEAINGEMEEKCTDHVELERLALELDTVNAEIEALYETWNNLSLEIEEVSSSL